MRISRFKVRFIWTHKIIKKKGRNHLGIVYTKPLFVFFMALKEAGFFVCFLLEEVYQPIFYNFLSTSLVWTSQVVPTCLFLQLRILMYIHSIVSTYICKIFIALTVFAINLTCILCTLSYNMTLSIANYETAKSKSHHVCRWQWFCRKKGRRGHFPKCPKQHKTFMYLERNSHHFTQGLIQTLGSMVIFDENQDVSDLSKYEFLCPIYVKIIKFLVIWHHFDCFYVKKWSENPSKSTENSPKTR